MRINEGAALNMDSIRDQLDWFKSEGLVKHSIEIDTVVDTSFVRLSGLRVSLAIAIILLVAAEMLGAEQGIGAYILEAGSLYDLERLFAGVVILSMLGVLISTLIGWIEGQLLRWRR